MNPKIEIVLQKKISNFMLSFAFETFPQAVLDGGAYVKWKYFLIPSLF